MSSNSGRSIKKNCLLYLGIKFAYIFSKKIKPCKKSIHIFFSYFLARHYPRDYNQALDISRFEVPVEATEENYDPFTIEFEQENSTTHLVMIWDNSKVSIPIIF